MPFARRTPPALRRMTLAAPLVAATLLLVAQSESGTAAASAGHQSSPEAPDTGKGAPGTRARGGRAVVPEAPVRVPASCPCPILPAPAARPPVMRPAKGAAPQPRSAPEAPDTGNGAASGQRRANAPGSRASGLRPGIPVVPEAPVPIPMPVPPAAGCPCPVP
ncbi:MAG: hypothetical protein HOQ24_02970 [Mycobacteriaceae bacterium]|nr:hypothetical protein [Mycobacteriaceae bacterium]